MAPRRAPSSPDAPRSDALGAWRWGGVAALVLASGLILAGTDLDRCDGLVPGLVVALGWFFAPAVAIACVAVVAAKTTDRLECWLTGVVAGLLTVGWVLAMSWVSLGTALHNVGC